MAWSNSNYSNVASATTQPAPVTQLGTPTGLTATAVVPLQTDTTAKVNLAWVSGSGGNEISFGIEQATVSTGPFTQIATAARLSTTYQVGNLAFSTSYYFRVRALA